MLEDCLCDAEENTLSHVYHLIFVKLFFLIFLVLFIIFAIICGLLLLQNNFHFLIVFLVI